MPLITTMTGLIFLFFFCTQGCVIQKRMTLHVNRSCGISGFTTTPMPPRWTVLQNEKRREVRMVSKSNQRFIKCWLWSFSSTHVKYSQWGRNGFYLGELPIFFLEILGELLENFSPNITKYSIKNWSYWNLGESRNSGSHQFRPHCIDICSTLIWYTDTWYIIS